jgi:hypothetical protein
LRPEDRKFILTLSAAFAVLAALFGWRERSSLAAVALVLAFATASIGVLAPAAVPGFRRRWMAGAHAISKVTTPIVLGVVYYLVLTPTGLVRRALGRSPLARRRAAKSYWVQRATPGRPPTDMRRQF